MKAVVGITCVTAIVATGFLVGPNFVQRTGEQRGTAFENELRAAQLDAKCSTAQSQILHAADDPGAREVLDQCEAEGWKALSER